MNTFLIIFFIYLLLGGLIAWKSTVRDDKLWVKFSLSLGWLPLLITATVIMFLYNKNNK